MHSEGNRKTYFLESSHRVYLPLVMRRSDIIPIDSRSHLEVADRKHRYAKNLRTYFKEFHRQIGADGIAEVQNAGTTVVTPSKRWNRYDPFFEWLDNQEVLPDVSAIAGKRFDGIERTRILSC